MFPSRYKAEKSKYWPNCWLVIQIEPNGQPIESGEKVIFMGPNAKERAYKYLDLLNWQDGIQEFRYPFNPQYSYNPASQSWDSLATFGKKIQ